MALQLTHLCASLAVKCIINGHTKIRKQYADAAKQTDMVIDMRMCVFAYICIKVSVV